MRANSAPGLMFYLHVCSQSFTAISWVHLSMMCPLSMIFADVHLRKADTDHYGGLGHLLLTLSTRERSHCSTHFHHGVPLMYFPVGRPYLLAAQIMSPWHLLKSYSMAYPGLSNHPSTSSPLNTCCYETVQGHMAGPHILFYFFSKCLFCVSVP